MQNAKTVLVLKGLQLVVIHRAIGSAEIHSAFGYLLDSTARTNGLVIDLESCVLLVVLIEPFGIHRIRKGRTGTIDGKGTLCHCDERQHRRSREQSDDSLHTYSPSWDLTLITSQSASFVLQDCYNRCCI